MKCFENLGVGSKLYTLFNHGALKGTGKLFVYAVDQGIEIGPAASFSENPDAYDPSYHIKFAVDAGLSAIAAPLGLLKVAAPEFIGKIPMILKLNSGNRLMNKERNAPDQAITASVAQALELGCAGIGFTIYPGSDASLDMYADFQVIAQEAKAHGLFVLVWAYPRGNMVNPRALDIIAYSTHIACVLGADIVKVKMPESEIEEQHDIYKAIPYKGKADRVKHIMDTAFKGKVPVLFSGEVKKDESELLDDVRAIKAGGGTGSIIGRNLFQRPYKDALRVAREIVRILNNS
ncbi:MAG: class I fructose-bisphosphate aldolase [Alphaproteobacteria bacterium]|nr:MAG: class I fructose-bisphosphate aldolase [Alphaproteobacteria bacterium]